METEQSSSCLTFSWLPISFLSCFYLCLKSKPQPRFSYNINEVSKQPRKCVVKIEFLWGVFTAKNQHYYEQFSFSFFLEEKLFLLSEALWDTGLSSKPWKLIKEKKKRKKEKSNYFYQNFDTQRGKVRFEANLNEKLSREDQTRSSVLRRAVQTRSWLGTLVLLQGRIAILDYKLRIILGWIFCLSFFKAQA